MKYNKQHLLPITTVILLAICTAILFWLGEKTINQDAQSGYTVIAFEELDQKTTTFFIENREEKTNTYKIDLLVNGEKVKSLEKTLKPFQTKPIEPEIKINPPFRFEAKIKWDGGERRINKKISGP